MNDTLTKTGIIAIVDDDEPLREALGSVMKAAGFTTNTFATAEEFLNSANRRNTACLILDVRLPGMSGVELQKRLAEAKSQVPIIFVTAHGDASLRESGDPSRSRGLSEQARSERCVAEGNSRGASKD